MLRPEAGTLTLKNARRRRAKRFWPAAAAPLSLVLLLVSLHFYGRDRSVHLHTVDGKKLILDCKGGAGKMTFTIQDDGSLTGPPGTFMPPLRKRKS